MAGNKEKSKVNHKVKVSKSNGEASTANKPEDDARPEPDLSLLRKSIKTSVTGFAQARSVFDTGTEELKDILSQECDMIYECRVCRNLFRSLANFISHKRIYCREKFNMSVHTHFTDSNFLKNDTSQILQNELDYQAFLRKQGNDIPCNIDDSEITAAKKKLSTTKDLTSIIEKLAQQKGISDSKDFSDAHLKFQNVPNTKVAVYQNVFTEKTSDMNNTDLIKEQITELENMLDLKEAVLGPDGKILSPSTSPGKLDSNNSHICNLCNLTFSTQKTLKCHIKNKHADNRLVYPCLYCTETFTNVWSVYRHLYKVHRKNPAHIRKIRDSIQRKAYTKENINEETTKDTSVEDVAMSDQLRMDQENQAWMDNFETDGEVPRCGGCGRKFERRAALISHRQTCQLRIAALNKISSNMKTKAVPKSNKTSSPEVEETSITQSIPKIFTKPCEKKIEIKIRRDYNKGPSSSNTSLVESSHAIDISINDVSEEKNLQNSEPTDNHLEIDGSSKTLIEIDTDDSSKTAEGCDDAEAINVTNTAESDNIVTIIDIASPKCDTNVEDDSNSPVTIKQEELSLESSENICDETKAHKNESLKTDDMMLDPNVVIKEETLSEINFTESDTIKTEDESGTILDSQSDSSEKTVCEHCSQDFSSNGLYKKHMAKHLDWKRFKCKLCNFRSYNRYQCVNHIQNIHKIDKHSKGIDLLVVPIPPSQTRSKVTYVSEFKNEKESLPESSSETQATCSEDPKLKPNLILKLKVVKNKKNISAKRKVKNITQVKNSLTNAKNKKSCKKVAPKSKKIKKEKDVDDSTDFKYFEIVNNVKMDQIEENVKEKFNFMCEKILSTQDQSIDNTPLEADSPIITPSSPIKESVNETDLTKDKQVESLKKIVKPTKSLNCSTERPIRNRVKLLNKDFEYDLSNLLKNKLEFHEKESIVSPFVTVKKQLKRDMCKKLLQTDKQDAETSLTSQMDHPNNSSVKGNRAVTPEKLNLEKWKSTVSQKLAAHRQAPQVQGTLHQNPGFLIAVSSRACLQGRAHMANLYSQNSLQQKKIKKQSTKRKSPPKKEKHHPIPHLKDKKMKIVKVNLVQHQLTPMKISEKYSSEMISNSSLDDVKTFADNKSRTSFDNISKSSSSQEEIITDAIEKPENNVSKKRKLSSSSNGETNHKSEVTFVLSDSDSEKLPDMTDSLDSSSNDDNDFKFFISRNHKTYSKLVDNNPKIVKPERDKSFKLEHRVILPLIADEKSITLGSQPDC